MAIAWGPTNGTETAEGRFERDVTLRGGDHGYTYDVDGNLTATYDVDSRNERDFFGRLDDRNERVYVGPAGETPLADLATADNAEDVAAGHEVD
jgi:hypothetical protein